MKFTRRTVVKGSAVAGGALLVGRVRLGAGELETLVAARPENQAAPVEDYVSSACWIGKQDCGIVARRIDGRVVKIEGHPDHPRNRGKLCPKGAAQIATLYDPNRVTTPLIRTNEKGIPGKWRQASWDEALTLVADRLKAALQKDKRLTGMVTGRTKVGSIYDTAFRAAVGIPYSYGRRGNDCGGAVEDAVLATWGDRSVISPDLRQCKYLICYWSLTQAGGPGYCWITLPQEVVEAKARGMKVVAINPYVRPAAHFADEWVPIKPGTDMAFWLAIIRILLAEGYVDKEFLTARTNAASLVKEDGTLFKEGEKELVWDAKAGKAVPFGPEVDAALTGQFEVAGAKVRPALQVLQDQVQPYTSEWAAGVCGVPAEQIDRIGRELGQNAMIGNKVIVDGVEVPYRPVAFGMHGNATKFHSALQTNRAILLAFMILGAVEAAGGPHLWNKKVEEPAKVQEGWLKAAAKDVPDRLDLGGTKWFPLGASGYHYFPITVLEPEKYRLPYRPEDMALIVDYLNPLITSRPTDKVLEAWKRFGFVAMVTPNVNATADYAADVVLPCGTLDKWEGPLGVKTLYASGDTVRVPLMEPLGQCRSETEIYRDICEKMGKLYGEGGFIDEVYMSLSL
ncbi:MAG: molybdopterin-dependent oxidoreductase [Chloroflexi bacterium]|nr:molybdopterin-dependent oxidoreductase [Chloroflexota bacterium]